MSSLGSFSPLQNPDIDRISSILGKVINTAGEITINSIESDYLYLGTDNDEKAYYFNINGMDYDNPGIKWNDTHGKVEFSSTGTTWYAMEYVNPGTGIDVSRGTDTVDVSVDVSDIIDTSAGITESGNKIQCSFGTGSTQVARGNHTHSYALADLSNVSSDTATDGNILSGNGTSWASEAPDSAGIVTKAGEQTITGDKTFSGDVTVSGEAEFTNDFTCSGDAIFSGTAGFSDAVTFSSTAKSSSYFDLEEISDPSNPPADTARIYARDNGSGKTQLCVIFPTGSALVIATEA